MAPEFDPAIAAHYRHDPERDRLETWARLEGIRTRELLSRFLPAPPAVVFDIGGARGAYALPLAQEGYEVHLIDPYLPHVEAAAASAGQPDAPLASVAVGDARELPFADASADAVLLFGPLYHLPAANDRARALVEARRVLRSGGVLLAAGISRFASTFDGVRLGLITDPTFEGIVEGDLRDGVHRNPDPDGRPEWFTLAYFHWPEELRDEFCTKRTWSGVSLDGEMRSQYSPAGSAHDHRRDGVGIDWLVARLPYLPKPGSVGTEGSGSSVVCSVSETEKEP